LWRFDVAHVGIFIGYENDGVAFLSSACMILAVRTRRGMISCAPSAFCKIQSLGPHPALRDRALRMEAFQELVLPLLSMIESPFF